MKQDSFAADSGLLQALEQYPAQFFALKVASSSVREIPQRSLHSPRWGGDSHAGVNVGQSGHVPQCRCRFPANEPYSMTAMACKDSDLEFVALGDLEELIRAEPSLSPRVFQVLAAEVRCAPGAF